jgi:DHA1 family multidrug resistance protein-like MFS transporter
VKATATDHTILQWPVLLGSLALTLLPFLLPIYAKHLGASALGIGGLFTIAQFMLILCRPAIGWALDRCGRRVFFIAGIACYTGAMGLFALASSLTMLYLAQLVQGLSTALIWTSAYTMATELAPPAQQGQVIGSIDEYSSRGALLGIAITVVLLSWLSLPTAWHLVFLSYALLAVGGLWLAGMQLPETRPPHSILAERQPLVWRPLVQVMAIVFVSQLCIAMIRPVFLIFLQDYFTTDVRLLALAFIPGALIDSFLPSRLGGLSDRFGRAPLIVAGLTWTGLCSLLIPGLPHLAWLIIFWTLKTLGLAMAIPPQKALISDLTAHAKRGTGYGLYTFTASVGAAVGPLLGGWLYDAVGRAVPFYLTGIVLLASCGWAFLLLRRISG